MILTLHIVIALGSIFLSTYLFLRPSNRLFLASYSAVGATIASGSLLLLSQPISLTHACVSGLTYTAFTLVAIATARRKLAKI